MTEAIFPTLPGLTWNNQKTPQFATRSQRSVSGKLARASLAAAPIYRFSLAYEFLRAGAEAELQTLLGFFLARLGAGESFLYADPSDSVAVNVRFGTGDGTTRSFQLIRSLGPWSEPVAHVAELFVGRRMWAADARVAMWPRQSSTPLMWSAARDYADGDYSLAASGLLTFNVAPQPGEPLYWSGTYYHRCRFKDDEQDFGKFMDKLWSNKKVEFIGALGVKL